MKDIIREIGVAVHLGFSFPRSDSEPLHHRQTELKERWMEYIRSLSDREGLLLYVPLVGQNQLSPGKETALQLEMLRLSRRFIPIRLGIHPLSRNSNVLNVLETHGYRYDPDQTKLVPFGELREICVSACGIHIKRALNISDDTYIEPRLDLSLGHEEYEEIMQWRRQLKRAK